MEKVKVSVSTCKEFKERLIQKASSKGLNLSEYMEEKLKNYENYLDKKIDLLECKEGTQLITFAIDFELIKKIKNTNGDTLKIRDIIKNIILEEVGW